MTNVPSRMMLTPTRIAALSFLCLVAVVSTGCSPSYHQLRREGKAALADGAYGSAQILFEKAEMKKPRRHENLHDLATCSVMLARQKLALGNKAAAMRELDDAIAYYNTALDVFPGHFPSIQGKSVALKMRGNPDEALRHAARAADIVGPSAPQYTFLARELDERGDKEGALRWYREAVRLEPKNFGVHVEFAKFLLKHGDESSAVYHLQQAYRINPADAWVVDELAKRGRLPSIAPKPTEGGSYSSSSGG